ncbi:unnamed protein product, partial [Heterotrigona itama]
RAIITYLANQYGKDDSLYPKDPKKRALVDQRLYFDACTLYKACLDYYYPIVFYKAPRDPTKYVAIGTALSFLEKFLEGQDYVAGKTMTLADLAIVVTISTLEILGYNLGKYKNVTRWFARIRSEAPNYEDNDAGAKARAIMSYLADQYSKNVHLNPQTPSGRALVNHRLHFDIGTLYKGMKNCYYPVVFGGAENYNPEDYKVLESAFDILDKFLDGQDYVAGRNLTIADLAIAATVSTSEVFGFEVEKYTNVAKWMDKIKSSAPGYRKANGEGLEILKKLADNSKTE